MNVTLDGIILREEGRNISPTIYINDMYKKYQDCGDLEETLMAACDFMERAYEQTPVVDVDSIMRDANEKIVFQLINTEQNKTFLEQVPHREFQDLSIVYKVTWLYIDEFHVLLNSEYSAKYLQQLWKKVRKQGGLCTGITQNVVDLLQNYTATTMLANSEFVALLKQANTDSSKMAEVIGVSEAQLRFVTNTASGMGLIKCGSVVIPFDNQISKDTDLYKLYNTNIHEIIEMKKHANEKC